MNYQGKRKIRVFCVMGEPKRSNSSPERLMVSCVREGGIWVCNSKGDMETAIILHHLIILVMKKNKIVICCIIISACEQSSYDKPANFNPILCFFCVTLTL